MIIYNESLYFTNWYSNDIKYISLDNLEILGTIPLNGLPEDIIVDGLIKFKNGFINVPDRPGLGIELDRDRVMKFARAYEKNGQYSINPIHCD